MSRAEEDGCLYVTVVMVILVGAFCFTWVSSCCEANAFNKHTGKNVSTWDALFLELRVDSDD